MKKPRRTGVFQTYDLTGSVGLFASIFQRWGGVAFATFRRCFTVFTRRAAWTTGTRRCTASTTRCAFRRSCVNLRFLFNRYFLGRTLDDRLRCRACVVNGCGNWRCDNLFLLLAGLAFRPGGALATITAFTAVLTLGALRALLSFRTFLTLLLIVTLGLIIALWLIVALSALLVLLIMLAWHGNNDVVIVIAIDIVAVAFLLELAALIALETFLHLGLRRGNDTVIMFGVLQIVFSHNAVAGALGITCERGIFLGYVLGGATNLNIRARTVIASRERIAALAIEVIIVVATAATTAAAAIVIATTPPAALVLLSWPHQLLT